ncbi:hypothetical protein GQ457_01G022970 [Hibiscus cannabinus]
MDLMAWNVMGLGNKDIVRGLKKAMFKFNLSIVFLSKTKQTKRYMEKIRMKMIFDNAFYVYPIGVAGSLVLWWMNEANISILHSGKNQEKQSFWESLSTLRNDIQGRWCIIGDSNIVSGAEEKFGGLILIFLIQNAFLIFWTDLRTRIKLLKWSKILYGKNSRHTDELLKKIKSLQEKPMNKEEAKDARELKLELDKLWESEERHWQQLARVDWLRLGDKNTKFFHATMIHNRRSNAIFILKNNNEYWLEDDSSIAYYFQDFFQKIYTKDYQRNGYSLDDWKKFRLPKAKGGLVFRDLKTFNQNLIAKVAWRIIKNLESLLA